MRLKSQKKIALVGLSSGKKIFKNSLGITENEFQDTFAWINNEHGFRGQEFKAVIYLRDFYKINNFEFIMAHIKCDKLDLYNHTTLKSLSALMKNIYNGSEFFFYDKDNDGLYRLKEPKKKPQEILNRKPLSNLW